MAQTIKIRRGTKAQLTSLGKLQAGEMGFCTDTGEVFIGNGTLNVMVGRSLSGDYASRPNAGTVGRLYYVTSGTNNGYMYFDTGTAWNRVNNLSLSEMTGTIDDVGDGTTYAKVKKSEIVNGTIKQLNDGTYTVTAATINTHINDSTKHRVINDSGTGSTDLWSAQKINNMIELAKRNIEPQASVKDQHLTTPPASGMVKGDRYIIPSGASGAWANKQTQIVEWNGSAWEFYPPDIGWTTFVDDEQKIYGWNGTAWVRVGGALQTIVAGKGLTGGGQADTVTLNIGAGDGITVQEDFIMVKGSAGVYVDNNGVSINYDANTFQITGNNELAIKEIDGGTF